MPATSGDDVYTLFNETGLHAFIRWMGELFSVKTPEMKKKTVVSAIYGNFIANETEARKFWVEVARGGVEYEDNSPQTVLDGWLKALAERKGQTTSAPRITTRVACSHGMPSVKARPSRPSSTTPKRVCSPFESR